MKEKEYIKRCRCYLRSNKLVDEEAKKAVMARKLKLKNEQIKELKTEISKGDYESKETQMISPMNGNFFSNPTLPSEK